MPSLLFLNALNSFLFGRQVGLNFFFQRSINIKIKSILFFKINGVLCVF